MKEEYFGHMPNLSNQEYHKSAGISNTQLKVYAEQGPAGYWWRFLSGQYVEPKRSADLIIGSAIHSATLEPDQFPIEFVCAPEGAPKRPTSSQLNAKKPSPETVDAIEFWREFDTENAGRTILDATDMQTVLNVRDRLFSHPIAGPLLTESGKSEQSFYARDDSTGLLIKCRFDRLVDSGFAAIDLKSTSDASPAGFGRQAVNLRYYVQAPWYLDILTRLYGSAPENWIFIAVEKEPPYQVGVYFVENDQLERGRRQYRKDLDALAQSISTNHWPDYGHELQPLQLPAWFSRVEA